MVEEKCDIYGCFDKIVVGFDDIKLKKKFVYWDLEEKMIFQIFR